MSHSLGSNFHLFKSLTAEDILAQGIVYSVVTFTPLATFAQKMYFFTKKTHLCTDIKTKHINNNNRYNFRQ